MAAYRLLQPHMVPPQPTPVSQVIFYRETQVSPVYQMDSGVEGVQYVSVRGHYHKITKISNQNDNFNKLKCY